MRVVARDSQAADEVGRIVHSFPSCTIHGLGRVFQHRQKSPRFDQTRGHTHRQNYIQKT